MFYLVWIISAFAAVGIGCFVAGKMDKKED
ncbi:YbgT family membrane protein [Francisella halioticida]|uniref:YbgT family membrane protein n=1 Tax=Francisella halioticida TaxID=549298 RepID=A0ABM6M1F0_9GAMM|nr:cytochrome bd oxidase small subunit, CydX/CbdX family [Francisella halioticida]ASG68712.1 YbgT family membrane protein [Francisella halioticida]